MLLGKLRPGPEGAGDYMSFRQAREQKVDDRFLVKSWSLGCIPASLFHVGEEVVRDKDIVPLQVDDEVRAPDPFSIREPVSTDVVTFPLRRVGHHIGEFRRAPQEATPRLKIMEDMVFVGVGRLLKDLQEVWVLFVIPAG